MSPLEILERLVGFETESSLSNLALMEFVTGYLAGLGVEARRFPSPDGRKLAILATIGPRRDGGIVLSGHTDCVSVEGQPWTADPFRLRVEAGRAHGRGAVDMKGFDALVLAAVPEMLAHPLLRPIHIVLSYDEETTCFGVQDPIAAFGRDEPMPAAAIVGEPTDLAVVDAHKSVATFVTKIFGREAHSSKPALGASAVMAGGDLVHALNGFADELEARGDPSGRFDPPYSTVHVGRVAGGAARNILARECLISWEFRGLPGLDPEEIPRRFDEAADLVARRRLRRHGPYGRIETVREVLVPGLAPDPGSAAERLALAATGGTATVTAPFGSEAGYFQQAGIATVLCGPGSIDQAHQPDEFIALAALAEGEGFVRRVVESCRGA